MGICLFTSEISRAVVRCVTVIMRELPLEKRPTFINRVNQLKKTPTCMGTSIPYMWAIHQFHWKRQCVTEIRLLNNTAWSRHRGYHAGRWHQFRVEVQFDSKHQQWVPRNRKRLTFQEKGWGGCDTCLQVYVVTWQWGVGLLSIQTWFTLTLYVLLFSERT